MTKKEVIKGIQISIFMGVVQTFLFTGISYQNVRMEHIVGYFMVHGLLYSCVMVFGNIFFITFLEKKWDWIQQTGILLLYALFFTVLYTFIAVFSTDYLSFIILQKKDFKYFFSAQMLWIHLYYIICGLGISLFFYANHFILKWKEANKREVIKYQIIAGTTATQLESLKTQIDPHFLFNSFNVLAGLIDESPPKAVLFTESLSKIYRYILDQKNKHIISLSEELTFVKNYIQLLEMRFEKSIFCEISNDFKNEFVVSFSLQLLLENAVKHNVTSTQKPLFIKIFREKEYLVVQNNYQKKEIFSEVSGIGLQNITYRYALITDKPVIIEQTKEHFTVKIPLLTDIQNMKHKIPDAPKESILYKKAKKQVKKLQVFYVHLFLYIATMVLLTLINFVFMPKQLWFFYPLLGWGIGIISHALGVFDISFRFMKHWEERKIQEYIQKNK